MSVPEPRVLAGMRESDEGDTRRLREDVGLTELNELEKQRRRAELDELRDAAKLRKPFFWFGIIATGLCMLASGSLVVYLLATEDKVDRAIIIAFLSSLTVQIVGLMGIIAKYLFPATGPSSSRR